MSQSNEEVAQVWLLKVKRLLKQEKFDQAHSNILSFIKFCEQFGFSSLKYEAELLHCQMYLELEDFAQAMITISKTLASLSNYPGTLGKIKMIAELKLA